MSVPTNCSNLKAGGGLKVADSICVQRFLYSQLSFTVVLSPYMKETAKRIAKDGNVEVLVYVILEIEDFCRQGDNLCVERRVS